MKGTSGPLGRSDAMFELSCSSYCYLGIEREIGLYMVSFFSLSLSECHQLVTV